MKKLLAITLLTVSSASFAGPYHHHHGYWQYRQGPNPWIWVGPTIVGGVIGYEIARNQPPVIIQQPPVVVQQPAVVVQQNCSPWTEIQNPDGTITRTRTCTQ